MERKKILIGLENIAAYYGRSQNTVKKLVQTDNFPAVKVCGIWESNTDLIDRYQCNLVDMRCQGTGS